LMRVHPSLLGKLHIGAAPHHDRSGMGKHLLGMDAQPKPARSAISDAPPRSVGNLRRYMNTFGAAISRC
jgi:hypothetical protein